MLDDKDIRKYIFRFVCRFLAVITTLWLICFLSTPQKHKSKDRTIIWKGYDPSRPASDISHLDYENMTITYRTYPDSGQRTQFYPRKLHNGVTITTGDGKRIDTHLTNEELFEQLDLEYEDLYEYYMD